MKPRQVDYTFTAYNVKFLVNHVTLFYENERMDSDTVRGCSRVQFLVSLKLKKGTIRSTGQSVIQVIYFSKYNVVLADVNNEF